MGVSVNLHRRPLLSMGLSFLSAEVLKLVMCSFCMHKPEKRESLRVWAFFAPVLSQPLAKLVIPVRPVSLTILHHWNLP
jgi:hypothetical protein